jgi:AhpD family alkylhydroperoxidase
MHTAAEAVFFKETEMKPRLDPFKTVPDVLNAMLALQSRANGGGLEHSLQELVKTRASQINGCAFCLHMHTRDARAAGETEERLYLLNAWRESPLYTERERAALAWTEALTQLADKGAPDEAYEALKGSFTEEEMVELTLLIVAINGWNRFQVGFRAIHPMKAKNAAAA